MLDTMELFLGVWLCDFIVPPYSAGTEFCVEWPRKQSPIETKTSCANHTLASVVPFFEDSIDVEAFLNSTQKPTLDLDAHATCASVHSACLP